jgi:FkbM family methyltransferase
MARFEVHGISLRVPGKAMNADLRKALETGSYEWNERIALTRHVGPEDRVLDIGAGAGFLSSLAAKVVGADNIVSVEASPVMIDVLRANLDENGARGSRLIHAAVVPDSYEGESVSFAVREAFWASALASTAPNAPNKVDVPALRLTALLDEVQPSIVLMDVEGAEVELCQERWPDSVRLLIMEIHTPRYSPREVKRIFDGLSAQGFTYMPWGTRGEVVTLQRVRDEAGVIPAMP